LNTKTQSHKVAIAEGKYREGNYREATIAKGNYHEVNIAEGFSIIYPKKNREPENLR
jgi:hypothetical protein